MFNKFSNILVILLLTSFTLASCSKPEEKSETTVTNLSTHSEKTQTITLDVYKDPNCGCCSKWVSHLEDNHFNVNAINTDDLDTLKLEKGIEGKYQSCHTGISQEGYVFEGHVPAKFVKQFLAEKPEGAFGLSVPSMPVGTPGMEMGDSFMPYKIFMLMKEGEPQVYADIKSAEEQH